MHCRWKACLHTPQTTGESSPGYLASGGHPSNGMRQMPHTSSPARGVERGVKKKGGRGIRRGKRGLFHVRQIAPWQGRRWGGELSGALQRAIPEATVLSSNRRTAPHASSRGRKGRLGTLRTRARPRTDSSAPAFHVQQATASHRTISTSKSAIASGRNARDERPRRSIAAAAGAAGSSRAPAKASRSAPAPRLPLPSPPFPLSPPSSFSAPPGSARVTEPLAPAARRAPPLDRSGPVRFSRGFRAPRRDFPLVRGPLDRSRVGLFPSPHFPPPRPAPRAFSARALTSAVLRVCAIASFFRFLFLVSLERRFRFDRHARLAADARGECARRRCVGRVVVAGLGRRLSGHGLGRRVCEDLGRQQRLGRRLRAGSPAGAWSVGGFEGDGRERARKTRRAIGARETRTTSRRDWCGDAAVDEDHQRCEAATKEHRGRAKAERRRVREVKR